MKNKIKIFIAIGLSLITTLIFTISTFAQVGYEITENGNIESLNLLDYNNRLKNKALDNNGNIVNNQYGAYVIDNIPLQPNTTYTCNITNGGGLAQFDSNMNFISVINIISTQTFTTSNNATYYRMDATPNNTTPMLNKGNTVLDYFPYGNYYDNKYTSLYQAFNNANVKLYNLTNNNLILEEKINIINSNIYNLQTDTPNIANYLNNEEGNNRYYYIIIELTQSINNIIILNTYNDTIEANAKIYSYNEIYSQSYERLENNDYIQIEPTQYYNYIYYDGFYTPDYTQLEISLSIDTINYSRGYNTGYTEGYNSGYTEGKASGRTEGKNNANSQIDTTSASYIAGYNDGQTSTNILGGMVINIAETPINIFKQIFDFNILGFDITQFLFSIVSLLLVVFLIKKIIK